MNQDKLVREVRFLKAYAVASSLGFLFLTLTAFQSAPQKQRFTEIDVERINVIQPDGKLALVLSNPQRMPGVIVRGEEVGPKRTDAGILYFNHEGSEAGGLTYWSKADGTKYGAGGHLSFDQYNNDQVVFLTYQDNGKSRQTGLVVVDRPGPDMDAFIAAEKAGPEAMARFQKQLQEAAERGEAPAQRVFVGSEDRTASVRLLDTKGKVRIRLSVDPSNIARMDFLDEKGTVVYSLPPK